MDVSPNLHPPAQYLEQHWLLAIHSSPCTTRTEWFSPGSTNRNMQWPFHKYRQAFYITVHHGWNKSFELQWSTQMSCKYACKQKFAVLYVQFLFNLQFTYWGYTAVGIKGAIQWVLLSIYRHKTALKLSLLYLSTMRTTQCWTAQQRACKATSDTLCVPAQISQCWDTCTLIFALYHTLYTCTQ